MLPGGCQGCSWDAPVQEQGWCEGRSPRSSSALCVRGLSTPVCLSHLYHTVSCQTLRLRLSRARAAMQQRRPFLLPQELQDGTAALSLVPWGHTLLVCTLLLLLVGFRLTLGSMKLVLPLNCISYLTVDLPGFTPSSRPQIKNLPPEAVMPFSAA